MNYDSLTLAFRLLKEQKAPLIAINKSRYIQTSNGLSLGPGKTSNYQCYQFFYGQIYSFCLISYLGCFVSGLEYSADIKAEIVGKPSETFFLSALSKLNELCGQSLTAKGNNQNL